MADAASISENPPSKLFQFWLARRHDDAFIASLLTIILLVVINGIVLFNAIASPFNVGYDFEWHVRYAAVLSTGRLPTKEETFEYFSAPLPYVIPALAYAASGSAAWLAKIGQLQNVPFSIGITLIMVAFARRLNPDKPFHAPMALLCLAILTVYYRTFAFFRGEPMLTFFLLLGLYYLYTSTGRVRDAVIVGICAGLAVLCRQWAFPAIPGALLFAIVARRWRWKQVLVAALMVLLVAGWFYADLTIRFGSPAAFNVTPGTKAYSWRFYLGTGNGFLFSNPVRLAFDRQFIPIFYTELWGDYWGYWAGHNATRIRPGWLDILVRLNIVNLIPTAVTFFALIRNLRQRQYALLYCVIASVFSVYYVYLIRYYTIDADTIKASYMLEIYPLVSLIVGGWLARYWRVALVAGTALFLHNSVVFTWHGYTARVPKLSP